MDFAEVKDLIQQQGTAFEAFKSTLSEVQAETKKLGSADSVITDKLAKIEKTLDGAVERHAALEAKAKAEAIEREALEAKLNRVAISGGTEAEVKRAFEVKTFNDILAANAKARNRAFEPLDATGYDAYKKAEDHYFREGKENLSADEVKIMSVGSDPDGGYFVTPDMSGQIVKKVYETSPMRQIASVQTISTDALEGIEDLGEAGAGYAGETAQGSDTTTPQVGKWRIPVFWIDTEPKATQQLLDDASVDIEGWLAAKVADKFSRFEAAEFITGAATKIRGILGYTNTSDTGSGVTWGTLGYFPSGAAGAFATASPADALYDLVGLLKVAYLSNAVWLTRRSVITSIRKFKDGTGNYLWQPSLSQGSPETIMGYPVVRAEDMSAVAANSYSLAFGDFRQAYQIVDRVGIRVLRDPYTSKPFIKFYTTKRVGGGVVNFEAIKLMKFATS